MRAAFALGCFWERGWRGAWCWRFFVCCWVWEFLQALCAVPLLWLRIARVCWPAESAVLEFSGAAFLSKVLVGLVGGPSLVCCLAWAFEEALFTSAAVSLPAGRPWGTFPWGVINCADFPPLVHRGRRLLVSVVSTTAAIMNAAMIRAGLSVGCPAILRRTIWSAGVFPRQVIKFCCLPST